MVTCSKVGFVSESHEVAISRDQPTRLDFSLEPEPVVEAAPLVAKATLTAREGGTVAGEVTFTETDGGTPGLRLATDNQGELTLTRDPGGQDEAVLLAVDTSSETLIHQVISALADEADISVTLNLPPVTVSQALAGHAARRHLGQRHTDALGYKGHGSRGAARRYGRGNAPR